MIFSGNKGFHESEKMILKSVCTLKRNSIQNYNMFNIQYEM